MDKKETILINNEEQLKRDPAIELARVLACLIVIGCHTYLQSRFDGSYDSSRLFISMIFADGVSVFWIIGGAFLFDNTDYKKLVTRSFKKVFIPMLLIGLLYLCAESYQAGQGSLHQMIISYGEGLREAMLNLLKWRNGIPSYGQTWYVYVYMLLMIVYPALKGVVVFADMTENRKKVLICGILATLVWNDILHNQLASFSHNSINGLVPAALISFIGYYLYKEKDKFKSRKWLLASPAVFIFANLIRVIIQLHRDTSDISIMYWYSAAGVIAASCILIFCLSLIQTRNATRVNRAICFVASYTFPVYLIHKLVIRIYDSFGVRTSLQKIILRWNDRFPGEILYTLVMITIVFCSSFAIAFVFRLVKNKVK